LSDLVHFDDISAGTRIESTGRTITDADILAFAGVSGDFNSLHMDDVFAREETPFGQRIAHGLLGVAVGSGLSSALDRWYILAYLECQRSFKQPIFAGDTIRMVSEITEARASRSSPDRGVITLAVELVNQDGAVLQSGIDVIMVGRRTAEVA
jgi:3-hydroxybutyryl-CoA dehydratase